MKLGKSLLFLLFSLFIALLLSSCSQTPNQEELGGLSGSQLGLSATDYVDPNYDLVSTFSLGDYETEVQDDGVLLTWDIPYLDDEKTTMDVFYSEDSTNAPIVMLIHGGSGEHLFAKEKVHIMRDIYTDLGYVVVTPNFRSSPIEFPFGFSASHDVTCATATMKALAPHFGADPNKVVFHGFSRGGYDTSFINFNGEIDWLEHCPVKDSNVRNFQYYVAHSANNFGTLIPEETEVTLAEDGVTITSPRSFIQEANEKYVDENSVRDGAVNYVDASDPGPVLFVYGELDPRYRPEEVQEMQDLLTAAGIQSEWYVEPGAEHGPEGHHSDAMVEVIQNFALEHMN